MEVGEGAENDEVDGDGEGTQKIEKLKTQSALLRKRLNTRSRYVRLRRKATVPIRQRAIATTLWKCFLYIFHALYLFNKSMRSRVAERASRSHLLNLTPESGRSLLCVCECVCSVNMERSHDMRAYDAQQR